MAGADRKERGSHLPEGDVELERAVQRFIREEHL